MSDATPNTRLVDADHPWLGLDPFSEATRQFFFGRDSEIADIFVRVRGNPLTVLYGQSGLGKTSLLGAGLFPKLSVENFRPAIIRLRYDKADLPLIDQVKDILLGLLAGSEAPAGGRELDTLWEMFHRSDSRPCGRLPTPPVLIFDQFEEVFTLGQSGDRSDRLEEVTDLFTQLADLVENRPPAALQETFGINPRLISNYDLTPTSQRIVLTLREDFLSHLEKWKSILPSLMRNRMPLQLLTGPQALEAVLKPGNRNGRSLVDEATGARIVRFVANSDPEVELKDIAAVPPLLSLVCSELNEMRIKAEEPQIRADHLDGDAEYILASFYRKCFAGVHSRARRLVEEVLVSPAGFRESVSFDAAVNHLIGPDVSRVEAEADLNALIMSRLLTAENRSGTRRLELTHDVLTRMAVRSRDQARDLDDARKKEREVRAHFGPRQTEWHPASFPSPIVTIRVLISGPGDVADERERARLVVSNLQRHYSDTINLIAVQWEELPISATASFQETIDLVLQKEPVDIAVFILWSRLGSPLGLALTRPDGRPYLGGIELEFELMLAAFEQSGGRCPVILAYTRNDETAFLELIRSCSAAELEERVAQRNRTETFIREQFKDAEGHNVRAYHSYREPVSFAEQLYTHLRHVLDERFGADAASRWPDEPYRGLEVFDVEHAPIFQGRDEEMCDILQRLRDQELAGCAFVVIVGASGSGKSSLARAGVAAALAKHTYDDRVKVWRVVSFFPGLGGSDLNRSLMRALAEQLPELRSSATDLDDIAIGLAKDATRTVKLSIEPAFARAAESAKGAVRILLLVDQMEELWTDRRITAEDRERFLDILEALARSGHIAVLATLRSDFYPHAQCIPAFLRLKGDRGHCDLLPPGAAALHRLITEPARLAGLRFEREVQTGRTLDQLILQDAARDSAALPLLQYTLSELYQQRDATQRMLTFAAYHTLGGMEGALGKRAAETFQSLPPDVRAALPEILPLLVTIDIAGEQSAVRRRAPLADLTATPARRMLTESLIAARFLTTDRQDDTPIVSLAHEALFRRWGELAEWVTSNRQHLRLRARVEQNQQRWEQQHRDVSLLLPPGLPLEEGLLLLLEAPNLLSGAGAAVADYIHSSEQLAQSRQRGAAIRWLAVLVVGFFFGVLAFMTGYVVAMRNR